MTAWIGIGITALLAAMAAVWQLRGMLAQIHEDLVQLKSALTAKVGEHDVRIASVESHVERLRFDHTQAEHELRISNLEERMAAVEDNDSH